MRAPTHPRRDQIRLSALLHALSDPTRLRLVLALSRCPELSCGQFDPTLNKATLSHHFKVLRDAGVTRTRLEGTNRFLCLRREDVEARFPGLLEALLRAAERDMP